VRVLLLHNRYRQAGGEDAVVSAEAHLLRRAGVEVTEHFVDNGTDGVVRLRQSVALALSSAWSQSSQTLVAELCRKHRPDILHVHNFWMALTPSVHLAARSCGVATVQTLHNYRLLCANALLLRNGKPCQDCVGRVPWRGVVRRCYRDSFISSGAVARMIVFNRARHTWERDVDAFVALSEFSRAVFEAAGLPRDRLFVKPNFVDDPGPPRAKPSDSNTIVYVGRLSREKGVNTLLSAWAIVNPSVRGRLVIVGTGPMEDELRRQAASLGLAEPEVVFTGIKTPSEVLAALGRARALVQPSLCSENSPRTVLEAFSCGCPVVASDIGALKEIVRDGVGIRSAPNGVPALAKKIEMLLCEPGFADALGRNAREEFRSRYAPEVNLTQLLRIYELAAGRSWALTSDLNTAAQGAASLG
jgi:glycosyltransferase involved in cell wall biosynthesis